MAADHGQVEEQEWPALPCSSEVLSFAGSGSSSHGFELLSNTGGSEDSFSLVSADEGDGWHRLEVDSDDQSDVSDLDEGKSSYLKKALAPSRSGTAGQPVEPIRRRPYTKRKNSTKKTFATLDAVMEEDGFEKAMADIMVTKKEGKFRGLDGHTGRKGCGCSNCREQLRAPPELSRTHEARRTPVPRFGYLADAIEKDEFGTPMSRLQEPYSITAFELNGGDTSYSLERSNAWWELPALLEEHSVAAPQQRTLANGSLETSYLLEPVGEFLPSTVVASAQHQLKYHIHQIQRHKPKLWVKLATDPPEGVSAPQLKTLLRCRASKVPQEAVVRCNNCASAWDVASASGHPLDIDLGATCDVAHFSTQGRHPPTRTYPHIWTDPDTKQRHIEDEDYNMFNVRPGGRYQGPWWTVKCEKHDRHHFKYNIKWMPEQWVSKYELWARGEQQGSAWSLLGVFSGNDDATTEVAHSFAHMRGGLRARYLRVRPLENVGGGALRVGVYGRVVPPPKDKSTILKAVRLARGKATVGDASDVITYTLTTGQVAGVGRENRNTRFARDRNSTSLCFSGGPYRHDWGSIHFATEAISARRQARQEAKEFTWGLHDLDDDVSTLAEMSRDPTCDYEYEMVYAPRPPVPLPVSRRSPLVVPASRNGWDAEREARCRAEVEWREPRKMTLLECVAHSPRQDCVGSFAWVPVQSVETDSGDDSRSRCL
mmetsp:Transcript_22766/g.53826  ORF Transcript_22766/g.53826 Transcript_22766/m.53826 type:complete len:712 (+) Transcript_22766:45-2180(+)